MPRSADDSARCSPYPAPEPAMRPATILGLVLALLGTPTGADDRQGPGDPEKGKVAAKKPEPKTVTVRATVVDDKTAKPIDRLIPQAEKSDPAPPANVTWEYSEGAAVPGTAPFQRPSAG